MLLKKKLALLESKEEYSENQEEEKMKIEKYMTGLIDEISI